MAVCSSLSRATSRRQEHRAMISGSSSARARVMASVCSWPGIKVRRSTLWRNASMRVSVSMVAVGSDFGEHLAECLAGGVQFGKLVRADGLGNNQCHLFKALFFRIELRGAKHVEERSQ